MTLDRAAPTKPCVLSGLWWKRTSSGISPVSPRSIALAIRRSFQSQKCRCWPYLPALTSSSLKPGRDRVGGGPLAADPSRCAAADTRSRSCNCIPSRPASQRPATSNLSSSSRKPPGPSPFLVAEHRDHDSCRRPGSGRCAARSASSCRRPPPARSPCASSARAGLAVSMMWMRPETKPGMTR